MALVDRPSGVYSFLFFPHVCVCVCMGLSVLCSFMLPTLRMPAKLHVQRRTGTNVSLISILFVSFRGHRYWYGCWSAGCDIHIVFADAVIRR